MEFDSLTIALLSACFAWSGFMRSGFGFGSSALMLPFALLIVPDPLVIVPAVAIQAATFNSFESIRNHARIDWAAIRRIALVVALPFIAGIYGLIQLSDQVLSTAAYVITSTYGLSYLLDWRIRRPTRSMDYLTLMLGGYMTGLAYVGGPPIMAVAAKWIEPTRLRDSILAFWLFIAVARIITFMLAGVDLQLELALLTLPAVILGHWLGLYFHRRISRSAELYRWIGGMLFVVSLLGLAKLYAWI